MGDDNIVEYLVKIGFTTYEAKTYSALITLESASASQIAVNSHVPRARIYDILASLERKGWIETINTKPIQFSSIRFEEVEKKLSVIEKDFNLTKKTILDELKVKDKEIFKGEDQDIFVTTEDTVGKIKEVLLGVRRQVYFSRFRTEVIFLFFDELKIIKKKGVKIKILLNDKPTKQELYKLKAVGEVKIEVIKSIQGSIFADNNLSMNIFDKESGLYATIIYYRKCINCLKAWLGREWEVTK